MDSIQQFIEQDLGKVIIAIAILIIVLVIVIVSSTLRQRRKEKDLEKTRMLHKSEIEKSIAKRIEHTQTISKKDILKELEKDEENNKKSKKEVSLDKTQELNKNAIRKKLQAEERLAQTMELNSDELAKRLQAEKTEQEAKLKAEAESKRKAEEARLKAEAEAKRKAEEEEARRRAEEEARLRAEEEARLKLEEEAKEKVRQEEAAASDIEEVEQQFLENLSNDFENEEASKVKISKDGFEILESFDVVSMDNDLLLDSENEEVSESEDHLHEEVDSATEVNESEDHLHEEVESVDEETDNEEKSEFDDIDIRKRIEELESNIFTNYNIINDEETPSDIEFELANESQEIKNLVDERVVDNIDWESAYLSKYYLDDKMYDNKFVFGEVFYSDDLAPQVDLTNNFNFGVNENIEEVDFSTDDIKNIFMFGINNDSEYESTQVTENNVFVFGKVYDDYTYSKDEEEGQVIFSNEYYDTDINDIIDVAINNVSVEENEVKIFNNSMFQDVIMNPEEELVETPEVDNRYFENERSDNTVVELFQDDEVLIDLTSQLDNLSEYESDIDDDFDFADKDYNYNFNNINIMDEVINDVLFDDVISQEEEEYFQYIYQFALLDNIIETSNEEVKVNEVINDTIVDEIAIEINEIASEVETEKAAEVIDFGEKFNQEINNVIEDDIFEDDEEKLYEVDEELLNLSSLVLGQPSEVTQKTEKDTGYSENTIKRNVYSPVFGSGTSSKSKDEVIEDIVKHEEVELDESSLDFIDKMFNTEKPESTDSTDKVDEMMSSVENEEDFLSTLKEISK